MAAKYAGCFGIDGGESVGHDLGVSDGKHGGGPEMRVGVAFVLGEGEVEDVLIGGDGGFAQQHERHFGSHISLGQLQ